MVYSVTNSKTSQLNLREIGEYLFYERYLHNKKKFKELSFTEYANISVPLEYDHFHLRVRFRFPPDEAN